MKGCRRGGGRCYLVTELIVVDNHAERQGREVQVVGVGPHDK